MKIIFLIVILCASNLSAQQFYYNFSELKGMEDITGNTQLFYRLYSYWQENQSYERRNDIYLLNPTTGVASFYLQDYIRQSPWGWMDGFITHNYDLFDNDPAKYIHCYTTGFSSNLPKIYSPVTAIQRYDDVNIGYSNISLYADVGISKQNDSLVYGFNGNFVKSTDGGFNWEALPLENFGFIAVSPFNDNIIFGQEFNGGLLRSSDGGQTSIIVDTNTAGYASYYKLNQFLFDSDSLHIYRVFINSNGNFFSVSDSKGDPFSWTNRYSSANRIYLSIDYSQSGKIYLADGRRIYVSDNYGLTFNEYKVLDRKIVGIYKKSNSDKLYAATKYDLYEITPDTIITLKHLEIDPKIFSWFPLAIGDQWFYNNVFIGDTSSYEYKSKWKVVEHFSYQNNHYAKIQIENSGANENLIPSQTFLTFRADSTDGKIYRAFFTGDSLADEELYLDLSAEVGDTIPSGNGIQFIGEQSFNIFGLNTSVRNYLHVLTPVLDLHLVKGLGIYYEYEGELLWNEKTLKGAVINGIVYGDTTLVNIDDIEDKPLEFHLSQNYPNPFNPSTKISWQSPVGSHQTLKVYDVLGREVATLVNEYRDAGSYEVEFDAGNLASGIYYYQLKVGDPSSGSPKGQAGQGFVETRKMILVK